MPLFTDRRTRVVHDIGMNAPPTHDPAAGLLGWASAHADARAGLAAAISPAPVQHGSPNVLPGQMNAPRRLPVAASPADFSPSGEYLRRSVRPAAVASRTSSWGEGSQPTSQTVLPGAPVRRSGQRAALPGFLGQKLKVGASFAQKVTRR